MVDELRGDPDCGDCGRPVTADERERAADVLGGCPETLIMHWLCADCSDPALRDEDGERIAQWIIVD